MSARPHYFLVTLLGLTLLGCQPPRRTGGDDDDSATADDDAGDDDAGDDDAGDDDAGDDDAGDDDAGDDDAGDDDAGDDDTTPPDDDDTTPADDDDTTPASASCDKPPADAGDTVYEIQNGSLTGAVSLTGLAVTAVREVGFFAQDPRGGSCSGIWVYTATAPPVVRDSVVDVSGSLMEYYDLTELDASAGVVAVQSGTAAIAPVLLPLSDLQPATAEPWESVLVQAEDLQVSIAPSSANWEWEVTDGSLTLAVDNLLYSYGAGDPPPTTGQPLPLLTGVLNYNWNVFKLAPRDAADLVW